MWDNPVCGTNIAGVLLMSTDGKYEETNKNGIAKSHWEIAIAKEGWFALRWTRIERSLFLPATKQMYAYVYVYLYRVHH